MRNTIRRAGLSDEQLPALLVVLATVMGLLVRLALPLTASFPLNDGGLFAAMIADLQASEFALPATTSYNHASIPFAYPPLALYVTAFLSDLLRIPLIGMMRILPALSSAASVPAFYLLARQQLPTKTVAAIAAVLFALTPRVFEWHIMGGGITRAFGFLFAILTLLYFQRVLTGGHLRDLVAAAVLGACTALTHPEAAVQTVIGCAALVVFHGRTARELVRAGTAAVAAALLAAPWWISVLQHHGADPFLAALVSAGQDSASLLTRIFSIVVFQFTSEPFLPFVALLAILGLFASVGRRASFLATWMLAAVLLEPRGGSLFMMIPLAMLAAQGLERVLAGFQTDQPRAADGLFGEVRARWFFLFLLLYLTIGAYASPFKIFRRATLTEPELQAMTWIRANTPNDAQFLVLTGGQPLLDPTSDWLPALTNRASAATVFGYEWVNDGKFATRIRDYLSLQACLTQDAACIQTWAEAANSGPSYVYIKRHIGTDESPPRLLDSLGASESYTELFANEAVVVFVAKQTAP